MSKGFTVKCNKCGTVITVTNKDEAGKIIIPLWDYGHAEADLQCPNKDCNNIIEYIG